MSKETSYTDIIRARKLEQTGYISHFPTELDDVLAHQESYAEQELGEALYAIKDELEGVNI